MNKTKKQIIVLTIFIMIMAILSMKYIVNASIVIDPTDPGTGGNSAVTNTSGTGNSTPANNTQNLYSNSQANNTVANNVNKTNTSTMPATGIDDTAVYIMVIFAISAIFAYKKMKDYKLK